MSAMAPRITLYSTPACAYCKQARLFLKTHRLPFHEYDIQRSAKARKQLEHMGGRGVPVIMVGGRRLDGFHAGRLRQMLSGAGFRL